MDEMWMRYFRKAMEFEEKGYMEEAIALCNKLLEVFADDTEEILIEKAKLEFRNRYEKDALLDFIEAFSLGRNESLYQLVLEAYLEPNREGLQKRYQENLQMLEEYPFYQNEFGGEDLDVYLLWQDEEILCMVNTVEKAFGIIKRQKWEEIEERQGVVLAANLLWLEDVLYYKGRVKTARRLLDMEVPCYLAYDRNLWMLFAQKEDLEPFVQERKAVFLVGTGGAWKYFEDDTALFPDCIVGQGMHYQKLIQEVAGVQTEACNRNVQEIERYYKEHGKELAARIQKGRPRILFLTSRFTTVLQYHTRDCMQAAKELGCETELLIEPDGIHRLTGWVQYRKICEFKPDVIFCIDHFRFEYVQLPKEIVWLCWVQDPLEHVMSKQTPAKLGKRNFVLNHVFTWKEFFSVGYPKGCLIDAPIPANPILYHPYKLSAEEQEQYACDLCFVCHASDVDGHLKGLWKKIPENLQEPVYAIYKGYQDHVYTSGEPFYSKGDFIYFLKEAFRQNYQICLGDAAVQYLAADMYLWFNQRVFRQCLVDWLLDAGYTDIKLWGNGWKDSPKYQDYAMGPAENGETLSKIYQASKIVIGNNIVSTAAARAWESMLSGAFYLSNYIPEESDLVDIRKIVRVGEDVVMFQNREELLEKVGYFLKNSEERMQVAARGRKAALEKMTFGALMERTLKEVARRLEKAGICLSE